MDPASGHHDRGDGGQSLLLAALIGAAAVAGLLLSLETLLSGGEASDEAQEWLPAVVGVVLGVASLLLAGSLAWVSEPRAPARADAVANAQAVRLELKLAAKTGRAPRRLLRKGLKVHRQLLDAGAEEEAYVLERDLLAAQAGRPKSP